MSSILIRSNGAPRGHQPQRHQHDAHHPNRPWEETQRDLGGSLLLGALTLLVLLGLVVFGLLG